MPEEAEPMARIPYLTEAQASPEAGKVFQRIREHGFAMLNLYRLVLHSPAVGNAFLKLGNTILFKGKLPPALREVAVLRVAHLTGSNYEWTQHLRIAKEAGLTEAKIEAIRQGSAAPGLDARERAVLDLTDEITRSVRAGDATFQRARNHFDEAVLVELVMVIAYYNAVSRVLEGFEVELEAGAVKLRSTDA
jgi:AhpD family alkylhydroperoxidase